MHVTLPPPTERARALAPRAGANAAQRACSAPASPAAPHEPWLEADGLGGYARVTPEGGPPRSARDGLLVVPAGPAGEPHVLVGHLEERVFATCEVSEATAQGTLQVRAIAAAPARHLAVQLAVVGPDGHVWARVLREVLQPRGRHATLVRWTWLAGEPSTWRVAPFLPFRRAGAATQRNAAHRPWVVEVGGAWCLRPYASLPGLRLGADIALELEPAPRWAPWVDPERGATAEEVFTPGALGFVLGPADRRGGARAVTLELAALGHAADDPALAFDCEVARRCAQRPEALRTEALVSRDALGALQLHAVAPGAQGDEGPGRGRGLGAAFVGLATALGDATVREALLAAASAPAALTAEALWWDWAARRVLAARPDTAGPCKVTLMERSTALARAVVAETTAGLALEATPGERAVALALASDLLASEIARGAGSRAALGGARRRLEAAFDAALAGLHGPARRRASLAAAMLRASPLERATRRALVMACAELLEQDGPDALGLDELAWFTEAALRVAPATRSRLAALARLWAGDPRPAEARTALALGAWLAARAALEEAPR